MRQPSTDVPILLEAMKRSSAGAALVAVFAVPTTLSLFYIAGLVGLVSQGAGSIALVLRTETVVRTGGALWIMLLMQVAVFYTLISAVWFPAYRLLVRLRLDRIVAACGCFLRVPGACIVVLGSILYAWSVPRGHTGDHLLPLIVALMVLLGPGRFADSRVNYLRRLEVLAYWVLLLMVLFAVMLRPRAPSWQPVVVQLDTQHTEHTLHVRFVGSGYDEYVFVDASGRFCIIPKSKIHRIDVSDSASGTVAWPGRLAPRQ